MKFKFVFLPMLLFVLNVCNTCVAEELRVMSYNILRGGTQHGPLSWTVDVIRKSRADIVGIQEADQNLVQLAKELGFWYHEGSSILSRYPITQYIKDIGIKVQTPAKQSVYVFNTHLSAFPYGPYDLRDGKTVEEAMENENKSGRTSQISNLLKQIQFFMSFKTPIIVTGDFNSPSHLDWTYRNRAAHSGFEVPWPTSSLMKDFGFLDSYRVFFPDETQKPGLTWTPGFPPPNVDPKEVHDRIDYIYYYPNTLHILNAEIAGESKTNADIVVTPWPSDHRAVIVTLQLIESLFHNSIE
ncbi:MAG: endonuclease/exonuclease/phosphatase family protein [Deltaproteobacteria bacterium]|nr:endonuclease/exonuclease/phosphatase family protein [Deltaproteobacteria bacterium]